MGSRVSNDARGFDLADQGDHLVSLRAMVSYGFQRCSVWKLRSTGEADVFAGKEEGSLDGPMTICCFRQPMGIATEFDSVVYVGDT